MFLAKTFKREVAVFALLGLAYIVYTGDHRMVEILVWPVFTFAGLAFGLDWAGKSGGMLRNISTGPSWGRPQYSSQYASWENQQPNPWSDPYYGAGNYSTKGPYDYAGQPGNNNE